MKRRCDGTGFRLAGTRQSEPQTVCSFALQPTAFNSGALRALLAALICLPECTTNGPGSALVAIRGRRNGARAARDARLQPNTSISPPMFNFEHPS
jgi:hypothetical protein